METFIKANGVELCAETFGEPAATPILLVGNTMLTWPDDFCTRLADLRRFVVRNDLRDTGRSTSAEAPEYTLRDLVADAAGVLDAHNLPAAHIVAFGVGGWIGQLLALDHADRVTTLTLIGTRPTAPGPNDPDLPEHAPELMTHIMNPPEVDWRNRTSVVAFMLESARHLSGPAFDEAEARETIERIYDRTPTTPDLGSAHRANQMANIFAAIDSGPRWRERLGGIRAPTLVIHGEDDPFFPSGNARALAAEIPSAELIMLPGMGSELPRRTWDTIVSAILRHTS